MRRITSLVSCVALITILVTACVPTAPAGSGAAAESAGETGDPSRDLDDIIHGRCNGDGSRGSYCYNSRRCSGNICIRSKEVL